MMVEKSTEFQVNKYLSLKLEEGKTNVYILGKLFRQCKYLLITIPVEKVSSFDELESIDEAAERLDHSLEPRRDVKQFAYSIPPEVEFWGHCSNLQVWYENGYNTRLLHSNLAFPLLRELARVGDPQAKRIYKEEVVERYNYDTESVRQFIKNMPYIEELSEEEFLSMIQDEDDYKVIEQLREEYPCFERREHGGMMLKINIDIKNGRVIKLDLRGLDLKEIPNYIENLTQLEYLNISYNLLEELPEWINKLQELKVLIMTENQFKELSEVIGELKNLEELYARGNQIETIPESIGNLRSLKILELYQNNLKTIPESIGNLTNLQKLVLYENNIESLPESIGNLKKLKEILLGKNPIERLPESIGELENLKGLFLGNNLLKYLPESIGKLKNLEVITITDNPIYKLPKSLYNLPKLRELYIDNTHLKKEQVEQYNFRSKLIRVHYLKIKDSEKKIEDF